MILSLFSGCGGLDCGFEQAGFEVGLAYDNRVEAIASWNRNRPGHSRGHVADLRKIDLEDMDRDYGRRFVPTGVIGGPPCQSFSQANSFRSDDDPRGKLVGRFFSIALQFHNRRQPLDFILMENVPGLSKAENGGLIEREKERLEQHNFDSTEFLLDAVSHSVPQFRRRLFILAFSKASRLMEQWSVPAACEEQITVRDAIQGLPKPSFFVRGMRSEQISVHPNHWCMMPKSPRFFDGSLIEGNSSGRSFKTLAWNRPSITVSYGHREVHVHPEGTRRLSVYEAMKLQGFSEDFVLEGSLSAQIDQVSEAVPPPLAEAVAISIMEAFKL